MITAVTVLGVEEAVERVKFEGAATAVTVGSSSSSSKKGDRRHCNSIAQQQLQ